ncbi:hypothetical protein ABW21_db0206534 [Orbilia brochopaga]|nr:hypothetical protein ABW21_db0206534 [Drechslerella brochopaga]
MRLSASSFRLAISIYLSLSIEVVKGDWLDSVVKDWPAEGKRICLSKHWTYAIPAKDAIDGCLDFDNIVDAEYGAGVLMGEKLQIPDLNEATKYNPTWKLIGDVRPKQPDITDSNLGQIYQDYLLVKDPTDPPEWPNWCLSWWQMSMDYKIGDATWTRDRNQSEPLGVVFLSKCSEDPAAVDFPTQQFVWRQYNDDYKMGLDTTNQDAKVQTNLIFAAYNLAEHYCDRVLDMWNIGQDDWLTFANDHKFPSPLPYDYFRGVVWGCGDYYRWATLDKYSDPDGTDLNNEPEEPHARKPQSTEAAVVPLIADDTKRRFRYRLK